MTGKSKPSNVKGKTFNSRKIHKIKGDYNKMTENAIKYQSLQEETRHNKEEERRKEKERRADVASKIGSGVGSALGGIIGGVNDPAWYNLDPQMVKDTASISFDNPLGAPFSQSFGSKTTFPGIMAIQIGHTLGDPTAIKHAAQNIYAFVRHANSGSRNYQPNDLISYFLAMSDIYSYHSYLCRIYSLLNSAKGYNRYYFDAMIDAVGGRPAHLRNEIAQLRAYINSFAIRANAYFVPKDLSLFQRRYWLYGNIFKDKEIKKSQEYLFKPYCLGVYDDTNSRLFAINAKDPTYGWEINSQDGQAGADLGSLRSFGDKMLNALLDSADIGIMAGDVLKAYGENNLHLLPTIDESYHVESIFSDEVLSQIHNSVLIGEPSTTLTANAFMYTINCPSTGEIQQGIANSANRVTPRIWMAIQDLPSYSPSSGNDIYMSNTVLNMYKDNPTPDDVMVATRLTAIGPSSMADVDKADSGSSLYNPYSTGTTIGVAKNFLLPVTTCGTEVCVKANVYTLDPVNNNTYTTSTILSSFRNIDEPTAVGSVTAQIWSEVKGAFQQVRYLTKFDFAPYIRYVTVTAAGDLTQVGDNMDATNYAHISQQTLKNMHYTAILSEYGVPLLGTKVRR